MPPRYLFLPLLLLLMTAHAQTDIQTPTQSQIDALAQRTFASAKAPGFALVVVQSGKIFFAKGYGAADPTNPITPDSRFAIGSLTKQFTAVAILQLAERGKINLDAPIATWLPTLPNAASITVRMLLNQTSGLHNYPSTREHDWPRTGTIPSASLLAILATDPPDFPPGTRFAYSNTNYFALALILEKVSGLTYADYLQQNIFTPLRMTSTANGVAVQPGITLPPGITRPLSLDLYLGAGSLVSTATDLALWDHALLTGALLNPASMRLLWTAPTGTYAMGFVTGDLAGHRELWHNGLTPTAGGYNLNALFPDDHLAIIILSNGPGFAPEPEALAERIVTTLLNPPLPATLTP